MIYCINGAQLSAYCGPKNKLHYDLEVSLYIIPYPSTSFVKKISSPAFKSIKRLTSDAAAEDVYVVLFR